MNKYQTKVFHIQKRHDPIDRYALTSYIGLALVSAFLMIGSLSHWF
jgi:hypothetical protein